MPRTAPTAAGSDPQLSLFDDDPTAYAPPPPAALPYQAADPAAANAGLAGDGYGWLAAMLPAPAPLVCEVHGTVMALADPPPLWICPDCPGPAGPATPAAVPVEWAEAA
ncbi:hypothetical protein FsymDg_3729 [Candidatus Protofrankia datiscae]|uniref:Uncharacterized protein n=1 Tax=Candidatus Protofrankia datiscae TaxID=2716812 RepID=F8B490_9ACTN|nr:hypothetical protein [Candidatus Protofrankia datiscae]AEH11006.1 hypothetical protein FsymDg_3729 [Candidatus Protofrankia datiscae]